MRIGLYILYRELLGEKRWYFCRRQSVSPLGLMRFGSTLEAIPLHPWATIGLYTFISSGMV